jgi:outer membrane protein assembly factor BamB
MKVSRVVVTVAALVFLFLAWLWLLSDQIRQMQVMFTYGACLLLGITAFAWLAFTRQLPPLRRLVLASSIIGLIALFFGLVRFRGVTGDWIPVVEWRWAKGVDWDSRQTSSARLSSTSFAGEIDLTFPAAFSRFLGPNFNSSVSGLRLQRDWNATPPQEVWRQEIGGGLSGFAIADGIAYTLEQRDENEVVTAYELETGAQLWLHTDETYFHNPVSAGPRTTPSVSQEHVFTLGATGILNALDRHTGERRWRRDILEENGARLPDHGMCGSPLLVDGLVIVSAGGSEGRSLVAYRQNDGTPAWSAGDDRAAFSSPVLASLAGERQIVVFNASSVAGHAIADGRVLWQHPWPSGYPNVAPPLVVGPDRVLFSTGYGIGAKMIRVRRTAAGGFGAELLWESPRMKAKFTNLVVHEGSIYGLDDGVLVCLDPETGERRWKRGRYGHGNILLVDDVLLLQTEKGEMVMIDPNPDEFREIGRFMALPGKAWNHFALVESYLLVRNDQEAALWRLPEQG